MVKQIVVYQFEMLDVQLNCQPELVEGDLIKYPPLLKAQPDSFSN